MHTSHVHGQTRAQSRTTRTHTANALVVVFATCVIYPVSVRESQLQDPNSNPRSMHTQRLVRTPSPRPTRVNTQHRASQRPKGVRSRVRRVRHSWSHNRKINHNTQVYTHAIHMHTLNLQRARPVHPVLLLSQPKQTHATRNTHIQHPKHTHATPTPSRLDIQA